MSTNKTVFIVGPGFIGWNVLDLLVASDYTVSALVRRPAHASAIAASGATPIHGELDDSDLIASHSAQNAIIIHTATADHLPSAKAVLRGVKARADRGESTIYIHTSGTSVLDDGSKGAFKGEKVYSDERPEEIDALPDDAMHREIDLEIVRASKELGERAKIAIMIPPEVYGYNMAHKRLTIQFPTLARFALKHGFSGHVGKGLSVESQIHVKDLARGYIVLLNWMESTIPSEVLKNPYFFCENGREFSWREAAEEIGKSLHKAGKISDPEPREVTENLYGDLFGDWTPGVIGLNSRSRADRLRKLGWEPREKGVWESWNEDELPALLAEEAYGVDGIMHCVV
ncbi:NAD(P)-binding protein [Saccharata proteae CBS 121410]|uniref:NAD(P)-binding protein n=1 Tax=Saccharata proteae CBS 121410 TaxID=1314787 RepID=A0A6A5YCN9_9PEZI|nr:NAD(P)-binding protein [Saccharata proteae CBS 121410]